MKSTVSSSSTSSSNWTSLWIVLVFGALISLDNVMCTVASRKLVNHSVRFLEIKMPNVRPTKDDDYLCTSQRVGSTDSYVIQFEPHADVNRVHHMILFGCTDVLEQGKIFPGYWNCGHSQLCPGMTIMYAWGKNAPTLQLPDNVGFKIGGKSGINFVILQVHYAHTLADGITDNSGLALHYTYSPQTYIAGIHLLSANSAIIPPRKDKFSVDINCVLGGREIIYPFAYRVHAHSMGVVITGYKFTPENETWTFLAKGNPQWPQAFYPMDRVYSVASNEILAARCTYNSSARDIITSMGATAHDEMCNLYIMYYTRAKVGRSFGLCIDVMIPDLVSRLPPGNDEPLPPNREMEEHAHNHFSNNELSPNKKANFAYSVVPGWPIGPGDFGQINAVDIDDNGHVVIFQRGKHVWNERTFDARNRYRLIDEGPITTNTVVTIDPNTQKITGLWGSNLFYLPHGLTFDRKGFVWVTDVALHQAFKFPAAGSTQPILTLGERFVPGSDEAHFCKPTSVAVSENGDIYIADGYCNSRVARYNSEGKFLNQWGHSNPLGFGTSPPPGAFNIPHKITLAEDKKLACVADREHGRVQCFTIPHGQFQFEIRRDEFNGRLFSLTYNPAYGGVLYAVAGPSLYQNLPVQGFVFNLTTQELLGIFSPSGGTFAQPHDVAVTKDLETVYVVEIGPNNLYMFSRGHPVTQTSQQSAKSLTSASEKTMDASKSINLNTIPTSINSPSSLNTVQKPPAQTAPSMTRQIRIGDVHTSSLSQFPTIISTSHGSLVVSLLVVPVLILIIVSMVYSLRKQGRVRIFGVSNLKGWMRGYGTPRTQEKFDLGRLLADPHKDGFNRLPMDESDADADNQNSDSEVEEFNAATATTAAKKV